MDSSQNSRLVLSCLLTQLKKQNDISENEFYILRSNFIKIKNY